MSVKILSRDAIREPFLNFLIEVRWAQGRMLKEYTVLLDPPSTIAQPVVAKQTAPQWQSQKATATTAQTAAAANTISEENDSHGTLTRRQSGVTSAATAMTQDSTSASTAMDNGQSGNTQSAERLVVPKGAVLWKIAEKIRKQTDVSQERMMIALFRANPDAFYNNNINSLKAGAILKFPDQQLLDSINEQESLQIVHQHHQRWNQMLVEQANRRKAAAGQSSRGQLKITAAESEDNSAGDQALQERLQSLLVQLDLVKEENVSLKAQVSELKQKIQQLAQQATQTTTEPNQSADSSAHVAQTAEIDSGQLLAKSNPENTVATTADSATVQEPATEQVTAGAGQDNNTASTTPKETASTTPDKTQSIDSSDSPVGKKPAEPIQKTQPESSLMADLMESPLAIGSVFGVLLLGLAGWLMAKRRRVIDDDYALTDTDLTVGGQQLSDSVTAAADQQSLPQYSELGDSVFFSEYRPTEINVDSQAMEVGHDDLDPISEADVYVAYGRYQQAEELIQQAMTEYPDREEYKLKLLEIFHAKDDSAGFTAYVAQLKAEGAITSAEFWARVKEIGADFASENGFGDASEKDDNIELTELSTELFTGNANDESLLLNDNLTEIIEDSEAYSDKTGEDEVFSIDLTDPGEAVDQFESAFELGEVDSEIMEVSLDGDESFSLNLTKLDQQDDSNQVDSQSQIVSKLDDVSQFESSSSLSTSEMSIDFDASLIQNMNQEDGVGNADPDKDAESFEFDSEDVSDSFGFDFESVIDTQTMTELQVEEGVETSAELSDSEVNALPEVTDQQQTTSSMVGEMDTNDSLGLLAGEVVEPDSESIDINLNTVTTTTESASELTLDDTEAGNMTEDFQLITETTVIETAENELSSATNDSMDFKMDDVSSELVESAQISEILDEVGQYSSELAEEAPFSELFEPASIFQESELFESELSDLDEVADKLDLAKAYIDMEDSESARGILQEVIESGNDDQKEIAKSMVQALEKSA